MARKIPPAETVIKFGGLNTGTAFLVIDIAQCLSLINRRFYRQGYQYYVKDLELISDGDMQLHVATLPDTWVCANAWTKAWKTWRESQDQVLDPDDPGMTASESIQARYADYKIFFNHQHEDGTTAKLHPYGFDVAGADSFYEWEYSNIQIPNDPVPGTTTGYNMHMIGPSTASSKGIISGYGYSRARPHGEEPNVPFDPGVQGWMQEAFDVGDNLPEIRDDVVEQNNEPPYLLADKVGGTILEYYPGGGSQAPGYMDHVHDHLVTRQATSLATDSTSDFLANCGLIHLSAFAAETQYYTLMLRLMPGNYQGVAARKMQDVN